MSGAENTQTLAAVVFLRLEAGASWSDLPQGSDAARPLTGASAAVAAYFHGCGFEVHPEPALPVVVLQGPVPVFSSQFGIAESRLRAAGSDMRFDVPVPEDLTGFVESIVVIAPSELTATLGDLGGSGSTAFPDLVGSTILGRFRITGRLGEGAMGEVYRAEDTELRRTVAIKRLTRRAADGTPASHNLLREARRASTLEHPRIARVYDVLVVGDQSFLVMEYIDGSTLRERLNTPVSVEEFCAIGIQCADALRAAHHHGILHGDLKPANIMLTRHAGEVKLCDFGVARRLPDSVRAAGSTLTIQAPIAGTPAYIAPEVMRFDTVDARADIFSLGVVFYEMLAGRNPFLGSDLGETLDRITTLAPPPLDRVNPQVPPRLARLVSRMLEKRPQDRSGRAADVYDELTVIQRELPGDSKRRLRRKLLWTVPAAAVVLGMAIATPWLFPERAKLPADVNVAVLPFKQIGGSENPQFVQGLTDAVNRQLSRFTVQRKFQVATAADRRGRNVTDWTAARQELGANVVLTGSLEYAGTVLRVAAVLIETRAGRTLREDSFSVEASDASGLERALVETAVRLLDLRLTPDESAALIGPAAKPGAYEYYLQGRGYLANYDRLDSIDGAITLFNKALELDRRYAVAYAGIGQAYWRKRELTSSSTWVEPARAACEAALVIAPNSPEPHSCLGLVLNGTGEYEKAAAEFNTAVGLDPSDDAAYSGLASAYEKLRRPADAESTFRRAIQLRPHYWGGYNLLGAYYYRASRFADAAEMFKQVTELAPDNFRAYSSIGAASFMQDRIPQAIEAFKRSLEIRPNFGAASNLGTLYFFEGEYRRAADAFRQAVSLAQDNYQVWHNLAGALEAADDRQPALSAYRRAGELIEQELRVNPRSASMRVGLADCQAALGDTVRARASIDQALELGPTDASTMFQVAEFFEFRLRQREDALRWLARAVEHGQAWREIDRSPFLRGLRTDPRFRQLRRQ